MAKRFIDSELFDDPWFMDLSKDGKILWIYCITKCDHAGVIELNFRLAEFQTGINDLRTVIEQLGNRLIRVREHLYFIPKFLFFQYPGFPNSKVKAQDSALKILEKNKIDFNSYQKVKEGLADTYGNGNGNGSVDGYKVESRLKEQQFNFDCIKENSQYMESVYRATVFIPGFKVDLDRFKKLTDQFIAEQQLKDEPPKNVQDYKNHYISWLKIQVAKPENQTRKSSMVY